MLRFLEETSGVPLPNWKTTTQRKGTETDSG